MEAMPTATLTTGLVVGNFSSPHSFTFEDGTVLAGCSAERCKALSLAEVEAESPFPGKAGERGVIAITPRFTLTDVVRQELLQAHADIQGGVVLVSFPTLSALKAEGVLDQYLAVGTIKADRTTKLVSTTKFCR